MALRPASTVPVLLVLVGAALLANPLYVQPSPDGGDAFVSADRTSPAAGAARLSTSVERTDDLPPVARYAARRALADGSFGVDRSAPPLALQLLDREWRYLGSQRRTAVYRTTVTVGNESTTLQLRNVSLAAAEADLGSTPPGRLNDTDHPKEVAWLDHRSDAVVAVSEFVPARARQLRTAVENGSVTVRNGNDATTFRPLASDVEFLVGDGRAHRVTVRAADGEVTLAATRVDNRTVLSEADVSVVATADLPTGVRSVVVEAIETDGYATVGDGVNRSRLGAIETRLVRHEGAYYLLRRGHSDDISVLPLVRPLLSGCGVALLLVGGWFGWRGRAG